MNFHSFSLVDLNSPESSDPKLVKSSRFLHSLSLTIKLPASTLLLRLLFVDVVLFADVDDSVSVELFKKKRN